MFYNMHFVLENIRQTVESDVFKAGVILPAFDLSIYYALVQIKSPANLTYVLQKTFKMCFKIYLIFIKVTILS